MQHTRQWFINRIGRRIYRKPRSCGCKSCQRDYVDIGKLGFKGEMHADYVYTCQGELGIEYFDKPVTKGGQ